MWDQFCQEGRGGILGGLARWPFLEEGKGGSSGQRDLLLSSASQPEGLAFNTPVPSVNRSAAAGLAQASVFLRPWR